jgi:transcription elongation GreA/GreB family factor
VPRNVYQYVSVAERVSGQAISERSRGFTMSPHGTVQVGSRVHVLDPEGEEEYVIVSCDEVDFARRRISEESPLGLALLGHAPGDRVKVKAPGGVRPVVILGVD